MTAAQFRQMLAALDLSVSKTAILCNVTERTVQHWRNNKPSPVAVRFLTFLKQSGIEPATVMMLLGIEKQSAPPVARPVGPKG